MIAIRIGADAPLVTGETVLCEREVVRGGTVSSLPSYRLFFTLPPLVELSLLVTNQRVLLHALCLRLLAQNLSLWFGGQVGGREQLQSVSTARMSILGEYLELRSIDPGRHWYRSQEMRLRLFVRGADEVAQIIQRELHRN